MLRKLVLSLEKFLDHDSSAENAVEVGMSEIKNGFNTSDQIFEIDNISYSFENTIIDSTNIERLVEKIACYFELVFLFDLSSSQNSSNDLKKNNHIQKIESAYIFGKKASAIKNHEIARIPETPLYKVYKTGAFRFLEKYKIQDLDEKRKMNCYLIRISKKYALVLVGSNAEPWSKLRIEKLQNTLMKINFSL